MAMKRKNKNWLMTILTTAGILLAGMKFKNEIIDATANVPYVGPFLAKFK